MADGDVAHGGDAPARPRPNGGYLRVLRIEAIQLTAAPLLIGHRSGEDNDDRRRPTAGDDGQDDTEQEREGEDVQKDRTLTLVAWILSSVKEESGAAAVVLGARQPWSGKNAWRRRFAAPWLDSWYGDEEEDAAELVVLSNLHGEVSTGGELHRQRRPCFGAGKENGEEEGGEQRAGGAVVV